MSHGPMSRHRAAELMAADGLPLMNPQEAHESLLEWEQEWAELAETTKASGAGLCAAAAGMATAGEAAMVAEAVSAAVDALHRVVAVVARGRHSCEEDLRHMGALMIPQESLADSRKPL